MPRLSKEHQRAMRDLEWWKSMLPVGWTIHGWSNKSSASAHSPGYKRLVELDPEFMCAMTGRNYEEEINANK